MPTQTLPGKASDYTINASGTVATHKDGSSHTIRSYDRFLFLEEFYTKGAGKFVGGGAQTGGDRFNEGWNAALAEVKVPARK